MRRNSGCARTALLLVVLALLSCGASKPATLRAGKPAATTPPVLDEAWYLLKMGGQSLGTQHDIARQIVPAQGQTPGLVLADSTVSLTVTRMNMKIEMQFDTQFTEDTAGAVNGFKYRELSNTGNQIVSGAVQGDKLLVTIETAGRTEHKEFPWDPQAIGLYAQNMRLKYAKLSEGQVIGFKTFMPELLKMISVTVTVGKMEKVDVAGKTMELRRADVTMDVLPGMVTTSWLDAGGNVMKSHIALLGGLDQVRVDEATAKSVATGAEIFANYFIPCNCKIADPEEVTSVVYKIAAPSAALNQVVWPTQRQTVVDRQGDALILRVASEWPKTETPGAALTREQLAPYLGPTQYIQSDDAAIRDTAAKIAGGTAPDLARAKKLEQWVCDNVSAKDFRMGFSTASEVMKNREGDCTEHAVLLAALCRAAGIPSRVACGVVYWQGIFGYHMWTEIYDRGWVAVDATMPNKFVDATHITLATSALDSGGLAEVGLSISQLIGATKIDVLEYATAEGKSVAIAPVTLTK